MEQNAPQQDLLVDLVDNNVRASTGKRFLNLIIDSVFFYAFIILLGFVWGMMSPDTLNDYADSQGYGLFDQILGMVLYALFMAAQEGLTKGSSLGKLITGTRAVNLDGTPITGMTALARGFSRAVPFSVFSALGTPCNPWQDKWTNTMVIDRKLSEVI